MYHLQYQYPRCSSGLRHPQIDSELDLENALKISNVDFHPHDFNLSSLQRGRGSINVLFVGIRNAIFIPICEFVRCRQANTACPQ